MEFNPTVKKKMLEQYPKLEGIVGQLGDREIRYVLLMYDQSSPLRGHYPELKRRKEFAALTAGFDLDKDKVEDLFTLTQKVVGEKKESVVPYEALLQAVSGFLKYQNNRLWVMIATNEGAFYELMMRVMAEVGGDADKDALGAVKIKRELLAAMDEVHRRLEVYYRELSGEDKDLESAITKRRRLTAESQAL